MNWTLNDSSLQTGMLVRRPGLDEALEVLQVRNAQAKIKLPNGKTSTIPATAEVEWTWPEEKVNSVSAKPQAKRKSTSEPEQVHISDDGEVSDWQTDWSLLDVGIKIEVLGEPGDFTVLRLTDSNARIKHNTTGQIQPLTIGHKFKPVAGTKTIARNETETKNDAKPAETKQDDSKPVKKSRSKKSPPPPVVDPEPDHISEPEDETALIVGDDPAAIPFDNSLEDDSQDDDEGEEIDTQPNIDTDTDNDDSETETEQEDIDMPATAPSEWLKIQDLSSRTGLKAPKINALRKSGHLTKSQWKVDPEDSRRILYHHTAIESLANVKSGGRGGRKPGSGRKAAESTPTARKPRKSAAPVAFEGTAAKVSKPRESGSVSGTVPSTGTTIDSTLALAIEHAQAQIAGLQDLIDNLTAQRESLKLWS